MALHVNIKAFGQSINVFAYCLLYSLARAATTTTDWVARTREIYLLKVLEAQDEGASRVGGLDRRICPGPLACRWLSSDDFTSSSLFVIPVVSFCSYRDTSHTGLGMYPNRLNLIK